MENTDNVRQTAVTNVKIASVLTMTIKLVIKYLSRRMISSAKQSPNEEKQPWTI